MANKKASNNRVTWIFGGVLLAIALLITFNVLSNSFDKGQQVSAQVNDLYKDAITPDQMEQKSASKTDFYAYFYQPDCEHCKNVSPILIPLAQKMNKPLFPVNIKGIETVWDKYKVHGTPTLLHFKDGKVVDRLDGERDFQTYSNFFAQN